MKLHRLLLLLALITGACNATTEPPSPTATETALPTATATITATTTNTATATVTATTSQTATLTPTLTITATATVTQTPTITPEPTREPAQANTVVYDNLEILELPDAITGGVSSPLVVFVNANDSETITNLATAQPSTNAQTLYFASPTNSAIRYEIIRLNAATGRQIFLAPRGNAVAFFSEGSADRANGLYVIDLSFGISQRILNLSTLVQRGIYSPPSWAPDGVEIAVVRENGYELDIYTFNLENSGWQNRTNSPANETFPVWSPDGRYLAFVSDRSVCPSWLPEAPDGCTPEQDIFTGGQVYVLDTASGEITQASEAWTNEPPRWINNRLMVIAGVDPAGDLLNPERSLHVADIASNTSQEVTLTGETGTPVYLSDTWTENGGLVALQRASGNSSTLLIATANGQIVETIEDFSFARFSFAADWSPDGTRLVIGGSDGQCPYGIVVLENQDYDIVANGNPPPTMCDPIFSPNGAFIAFDGVNPTVGDGRVDIYTTNANGFGAINLTANLRGQTRLLGWVSP